MVLRDLRTIKIRSRIYFINIVLTLVIVEITTVQAIVAKTDGKHLQLSFLSLHFIQDSQH